MTIHTTTREVAVMDGNACLSSFEVRYTFTITNGRKAGPDGPAEEPSVDVTEVEVRWHPVLRWRAVSGEAWDMLTADVPDAWFIAQAMEGAA